MTLEEVKVLITCSGLGSRLGEITNHTNKSLVRINNKPVISHIIDRYPKGTSFVITLGHYGEHVKQYLQIAHPNIDIDFVIVNNYSEAGSSLGKSMLCAKDKLKCKFIFHASDTLTDGIIPQSGSGNNIWVSSVEKDKSQYRTVRSFGNIAKTILEKGIATSDETVYIGKCYIEDYQEFWNVLENIINNNNSQEISDCHVINKMLESGYSFFIQNTVEWNDIGNLDSLKKTREKFGGNINVLDKNDESIYFIDGYVVKFFTDSKILKNRIERAKILFPSVPEIINNNQYFMKYKYVEGNTLSRIESFNSDMLNNLLMWINKSIWKIKDISITNESFFDLCKQFYINKTQDRVKKFMIDRNDNDKIHTINGTKVGTVNDLLKEAEKFGINNGISCKIHGDFILENIIIDDNKNFTLIDWRQDFAGDVNKGDVYYDLAKLNHNLHVNHDIIKEGGFKCNFIDENNIFIDLLTSFRFLQSKKIIQNFCIENNLSYKKVEILSSIIWINMSPLHDNHFGNFLFYFGKLQLHKNIYEK